MFFQIELLYLVAMIATFVILMVVLKVPSGVSMMVASVVGLVLSAIFSKTDLNPRHLIEGSSGYFDTILVIVSAMIFIVGLEKSGALEYLSALLVKAFKSFPTVLLICFMILLMLPGMITGSSLSAVISIGAIVAPIMLKMGIPKAKTAAFIAFGSILGMVAPPVNIPVIAICDVVDIPYQGFTLPLFLLTIPLALFGCIFFSRSFIKKEGETRRKNWLETGILIGVISLIFFGYLAFAFLSKYKGASNAKLLLYLLIPFAILYIGMILVLLFGYSYSDRINLEEMKEAINFNVINELKPWVLSPILVLVLLYVGQTLLPKTIGMLGSPLIFIIAASFTVFTGKKFNVWLGFKDGVGQSFGAMALLIGVGMFVQVMTLSGVRGWFVINAISLPSIWQYISIVVAMPIFGGVSAFGSASILGGPYVMALISLNNVVVASSLSLVAATGEFLPPTAMSATFAGEKVGEKKYLNITKVSIIPIVMTLAYAMFFIIVVAKLWG